MEKNSPRNYRINSPSVIYQVMDNEIVIINLESGVYYNIEGLGIALWKMIDSHCSVDQMISLITERYNENSIQIRKEILDFLAILHSEGLLSITEDKVNFSPISYKTAIEGLEIDNPSKWNGLKLNRYTDMQDLLLLDPIHDVNEEGWPNSTLEQN